MSLTILYSDRVADLAADLKKRLRARSEAVNDPFNFASVAVPNRNIEKWLRVRAFADEPALAAGVTFPFLDKLLFDLLSENIPANQRPKALLSGERLRYEIARLLVEGKDPDLAPLRHYVDPAAVTDQPLALTTDDAARKLWQISDRLATLSGEYDLRRPDMVAKWLSDTSAESAGTIARAERALARALFGEGGRFPAAAGAENPSLRQLFDLVRAKPPKGTARTLFFFGQSSLSLLHARILKWLARTHEVVFYHLTVCLEYWGDVESPWERAKNARAVEPGAFDCENELLSAWGLAGRETMRLLVDLEEENREVKLDIHALDPAPDNREPTVLSTVQSSVRTRTSELPRLAQDASLQLVKSQSIRREVETVYNAILGAVWRPGEVDGGNGPTFSDFAVLVPDMATYRPVIEEVFDGRGQIPYGLVDGAASQDSALLRCLL
ncbi:MAG: exodeoxyribonuclease V subunit gamma, partial [Kiritimatiellae bacterium]|nr:exodeoxyribonuclease V subunit gamma [Kiritimatiellia bacterium]